MFIKYFKRPGCNFDLFNNYHLLIKPLYDTYSYLNIGDSNF